jgi:hypothetical protein
MSNRNEGKPPICRITSLRGFQGVMIGRDLGGIFKEGHVYKAVKIMDEIIITDLGPHAVENWLENESGVLTGTVNQYVTSGVCFLTKEEYNRLLKSEE